MSRPKNDTILRALLREPVPYTPVWIMRQAGRYLPEYNATRTRAGSFLELCHSPELATEVTLQPLARFKLDAAILFSDILTIPDAMGLGLYFADGEGPRFKHPLRDEASIDKLSVPSVDDKLRYVMDAVRSIRTALNDSVPLIGFSGSPFTLACYMIEGQGSSDFIETKRMLYRRPDLMHRILDINAQAVVRYLNAQIESGAQIVQIFDTWGGSLTHDAFREFSLRYIRDIVSQLHRNYDGQRVPCIVFTKGGGLWLEDLAACGADALGLDWTIDIGAARTQVGDQVALQGNLDPGVLFSNPEIIKKEVRKVLDGFGSGSGHVFNLGHGISRHTPPENVAALVDAAHELSAAYH
ncbi:MAG: uroporphyrinogen decarboxylase [Betaproteobacteria bacterium]|nr:uroporphyrinogen decarboxylase [Betaproteobacteria bacterium]